MRNMWKGYLNKILTQIIISSYLDVICIVDYKGQNVYFILENLFLNTYFFKMHPSWNLIFYNFRPALQFFWD